VYNRTVRAGGTDPYLVGDLLASRLATRAWGNRHRLRSGGRDGELGLLDLAGRLVLFLVRHPLLTSTTAGVTWVWLRLGPLAVAGLAAWLVGVLVLVRMLWPTGWAWLGNRVRRRWRIWTIYGPLWRETMIFTGLARHLDGLEHIPHRRRMRSTRWGDHITITLVSGQRPFAVEQVAEHLAHSFGARSCTIQPARNRAGQAIPGQVVMVFRRRDPLVNVIAPTQPAAVDVEGVGA
jgi:S-DNA-T family DNA segregation ATPase FtsK/SpoIIIE